MNIAFCIFAALFGVGAIGAIIWDFIESYKDRKKYEEYLKNKEEIHE